MPSILADVELCCAGKFGSIFASLPQAMVSGLFCVMFGLIAAVGISQLQFTDMNSPRNIFITGLGLYLSLSIPDYFTTYTAKNNHGPINTGSQEFNSTAPPPHHLRLLVITRTMRFISICKPCSVGFLLSFDHGLCYTSAYMSGCLDEHSLKLLDNFWVQIYSTQSSPPGRRWR